VANLLSPSKSRDPFPELDPEQCARFTSRVGRLAAQVSESDFLGQVERRLDPFEGSIAELNRQPTLIAALELLDGIENVRLDLSRVALAGPPAAGSFDTAGGNFICYWPGRSLSTGEAEVASRGWFDVLDRPPIGLWVEAIARSIDAAHENFEIVIIAWIPPDQVERAEAGRRACKSGSLTGLDDASKALARQLGPSLTIDPQEAR
jgi:hypothetical protein